MQFPKNSAAIFACRIIDLIIVFSKLFQVCLQKHRTLEAEVHANQGSLNKLQSEGEELIADEHHAKEIIKVKRKLGDHNNNH